MRRCMKFASVVITESRNEKWQIASACLKDQSAISIIVDHGDDCPKCNDPRPIKIFCGKSLVDAQRRQSRIGPANFRFKRRAKETAKQDSRRCTQAVSSKIERGKGNVGFLVFMEKFNNSLLSRRIPSPEKPSHPRLLCSTSS